MLNDNSSNIPTTPGGRNRHRRRPSDATSEDSKPNESNLLVDDRSKYKSMLIRAYSTIWMIGGFALIIYFGHLYITAMVVVIQVFMAKELFNLLRKVREDTRLPGFRLLNWHFFFTAMLFVYGRILSQRLVNTVTSDKFLYQLVSSLIKYHMVICYSLYIAGFMWFILTLKKKMYKYQFGQYAWTHMILIVVFTQSSFTVANIFEGIFWFLLPASLIVINDIAAYIVGFFFGRTPLIKLSPKKTWEGFIGASILTIISAFAKMKTSSVSSLLAAVAIIAAHFLHSSATVVEFSGVNNLLFVPAKSECRGSIAECFLAGDDGDGSAFGMEFEMDSEINRRILATTRYISYGAMRRNNVPCSRRGASYYNCRPGAQANPYRRGCSAITRCRS